MSNNNIDIAAIKAKRERQDATRAQWARKYDGAKTAKEWNRSDFQRFIDKAPQLQKLTTPELRALFLVFDYAPIHGDRLYKRVPSLRVWQANRKKNIPCYELAMSGKWDMKEARKIDILWRNL